MLGVLTVGCSLHQISVVKFCKSNFCIPQLYVSPGRLTCMESTMVSFVFLP